MAFTNVHTLSIVFNTGRKKFDSGSGYGNAMSNSSCRLEMNTVQVKLKVHSLRSDLYMYAIFN